MKQKSGWEEAHSEEELVGLAQNGNEEAEEYLIRKYKNLVRTKARLYFIMGADHDDIMQEGMIGIFKAIRSYDPGRKTSFHTFADLCINRQIITAIKQAGRMKHSPLNTSVSLSKPVSAEEQAVTLAETLPTDSDSDPESLLLLKEVVDYLEGDGQGSFSSFEYKVWKEHLLGKSYGEMAKSLGKSAKSIDNAMQRTKRKIALHLAGNR